MQRYLLFLPMLILALGCDEIEPPAVPKTAPQPGKRETAGQLVPVTLLLNWFPEVEHGGYYAAQLRGYYRDVGLDVKILPGNANTQVIQEVATGRVMFGLSNADNILFARAQDADVVAVFAPLQTSPRCLLVHERSGIKTFEDLHDLTIAMSPGAAFAAYLRKQVPLKGVKIVPYPGNVAQFLLNDHYAQQGYVFSEPFVAREKGGDPHVLMLSDLGFNPYTSVLIATAKEIAEQPEVVRSMVEASERGWAEYLREPGATNERIHELNPEIDLPALQFGAEAIAPLVLTDEARDHGLGTMTLERWQTLERQLVESDQLPAGKVDVSRAFTTRFLPDSPREPAK